MSEPTDKATGTPRACHCSAAFEWRSIRLSVDATVMWQPGQRVKNKHTGTECKVFRVDDSGGCTLQTKHGRLYFDFLLMAEHWESV